jgi:hypothetical protein
MAESEKITRKKRIDLNLKKPGWQIVPYQPGLNTSTLSNHAVEEYPTAMDRQIMPYLLMENCWELLKQRNMALAPKMF